MPFTVSHIAAVLPGYRPLTRAHVFTAAVIGSMVPDFGLLVPGVSGYVPRWQTHSLPALITFCLPMGLMVYWLTMLLLRPAILEVLPDRAYLRLKAGPAPPSILSLPAWAKASAALLLGAITHLIWDGFTHENARGVRMFPLLTDYVPEMGHSLHLWRWLQYGSSVFGLVVVAWALVVWMRHAPAPDAPVARRIGQRERLLWLCAYALPPLAMMVWTMVRLQISGLAPLTNGFTIGFILIRTMKYCAATLLSVSIMIQARLAL